jgi:dihydrofolate synthase/folylpolyglutamate synthase
MNGIHQTKNAATAVKTIEIMNESLHEPITDIAIMNGIRNNFVPGRIELIKGKPDIIIDGGHNTEGIRVLSEFLKLKEYKNCILIFGVLRDKKYKIMVNMLMPFIKNIILLSPKSNRALSIDKLSELFIDKKVFKYYDDYKGALSYAKTIDNTIIITGSIYMIGEMRNIIFEGKNGY